MLALVLQQAEIVVGVAVDGQQVGHAITILSINLMGDQLRDVLNPRLRR